MWRALASKTRVASYLQPKIFGTPRDYWATWRVLLCLPWCAMMNAWRLPAWSLAETKNHNINNINNDNNINKIHNNNNFNNDYNMNKSENIRLLLLPAVAWLPPGMQFHVSRTQKPHLDFWKCHQLYVSILNDVQRQTPLQKNQDRDDHWAYSVYQNLAMFMQDFYQPCLW